ncbi:MAG: Hpt domain-containing protein, partial [Pseudomonadota bacterium]
ADYLRDQFFVDQPDDAWRDAAHAMKGAAQAVGAWRLAGLCDQAETCVGDDPVKSERRAGLVIAIRRQLSDVAREALILLRTKR